MEEQTAIYLASLYEKSKNIAEVMQTLDRLTTDFSLNKQLILSWFQKFLKARPDLSSLLDLYPKILSSQVFPKSLNLTPNHQKFSQLFHPISLTQCHQLHDSFTAIRLIKNYVITASDDGTVKLWDYIRGSLALRALLICKLSHKRQITNICVDADFISVAWGSIVAIWDINQLQTQNYLFSTVEFQLNYGVKKRNSKNIKIDVKDVADQLYFAKVASETHLIAQTASSIYLLSMDGSQRSIFRIGWFEREDRQKITWAAYSEATQMLAFAFFIRSTIFLGFVSLERISGDPYHVFYSESEVCSGDIGAGQVYFSSVQFQQVFHNQQQPVLPEVIQFRQDGGVLALTLSNCSAVLLYKPPVLEPRNYSKIDFSFIDLMLEPQVLTFDNMHVPAGLRAENPIFTVTNCLFYDNFLLCQLKVDGKKFDKSYLLLFEISSLRLISRCVLQGTGSGIAVNFYKNEVDWFWVVSDAENTNKDRIENIELGARDTFVYLLRKDLGESYSCCHIPNGQDESAMIFCDIQTGNDVCFVSNAGGQIMVIGSENIAEIQPQEQFFLIELPAFRNQRFQASSIDTAEIPGKIDIKKCTLLDNQLELLSNCRSFNLVIFYKVQDEYRKNWSVDCSGYQFYGIRLNILKFLLHLLLKQYKVQENTQDYYLGFKFLNQQNLHHNSYFYETINTITSGVSPFTLVSMLNKPFNLDAQDKIKEFSRLQENVQLDFWQSCKQDNSFEELPSQKSHYLNPKQIRQHGLLFLETSCEFLIDQDNAEYVLKEGVNYKNKDEDELYQLIKIDPKFPQFLNKNIQFGNEGYQEKEITTFKHSKDNDMSTDDLIDESSLLAEESDQSEQVVQEVERVGRSRNVILTIDDDDDIDDEDDLLSFSDEVEKHNKVIIVSDNADTETESSSTTMSASEQIENKQLASKRQSVVESKPKEKTQFQKLREYNWNYIQSFNSSSPEMFNKDLQSISVLQAGDIIYFNPSQYIETVSQYLALLNPSAKSMFKKCQQDINSQQQGIYVIQSIYTRFEDHIEKSYQNRKISWPTCKICVQDLILEPFDDQLDHDPFFTSNADLYYDQQLSEWFKQLIVPSQTLTIPIIPLSNSIPTDNIHFSAGIYNLEMIRKAMEFQDIKIDQEILPLTLQLSIVKAFNDDEKADLEHLIQLQAMREIDKFSVMYKNPKERKFIDYYLMTTPSQDLIESIKAEEHQLYPGAFIIKKDGGFKKISKLLESPQQQVSELSQLISKQVKHELIEYLEIFKPEDIDIPMLNPPLLASTAFFSIVEILTQQDTLRFFNNEALINFLSSFYDTVKLAQLSSFLRQSEIKSYNNQIKKLLQDQLSILYTQSLQENKKLNNQIQQEIPSIHVVNAEEMQEIQTIFKFKNLQQLTEYKIQDRFLLEFSPGMSEFQQIENNAFQSSKILKNAHFCRQYFNRSLLLFSLTRALQSSVVRRKQPHHIQNYFNSPQQIENYCQFIPTPVWINLLYQRVNSGYYGSYRQLINDLNVMVGNSDVFNANTDEVYVQQASNLQEDILEELNSILQFVFGKDAQDIERCCKIDINDAESRSQTEENVVNNQWGDSIVASDDPEDIYDEYYDGSEASFKEDESEEDVYDYSD
ncbi:hypothetical protein SS50377_25239 [Spironucleus salmonicida]|uniref:Bromo domain-containing protein n=1 Tax=Spironucleus salmonicida TaxID=348837 RepID=V6LBN1_9EUKA|nr:hypothetical protein SS50377_25239 [Spironucleus salmonicida]|eukprot:EST41880.1 hypothetical protein SS50377_18717 [Spironucleus salmonicida]